VGITGTPNVNVTNPVGSPVPVFFGTANVRVPFQFQANGTIAGGSSSDTQTFVVPAGNLLVIETVTATAAPQSTFTLRGILVGTTANTVAAIHSFPLFEQPQGTPQTFKDANLAQRVRLYADPGSTVSMILNRAGTDAIGVNWQASVSGYLVPVGSPTLSP